MKISKPKGIKATCELTPLRAKWKAWPWFPASSAVPSNPFIQKGQSNPPPQPGRLDRAGVRALLALWSGLRHRRDQGVKAGDCLGACHSWSITHSTAIAGKTNNYSTDWESGARTFPSLIPNSALVSESLNCSGLERPFRSSATTPPGLPRPSQNLVPKCHIHTGICTLGLLQSKLA